MDRMKCPRDECGGTIEVRVPLYFDVYQDAESQKIQLRLSVLADGDGTERIAAECTDCGTYLPRQFTRLLPELVHAKEKEMLDAMKEKQR